MDELRFKQPRCPKCGEPPREVKGVAVVSATLAPSKKMNRFVVPDVRSVTKFVLSEFADRAVTLICGGGHEWQSKWFE